MYPQGWLPWPVEWILAFPRCPYGAVSVNIWSMVCGTIISLVADAVMATILPAQKQKQGEKVKMPADTQSKQKATGQRARNMSAASID